jgi:DNA-binding NarL/FixJ family response regulator
MAGLFLMTLRSALTKAVNAPKLTSVFYLFSITTFYRSCSSKFNVRSPMPSKILIVDDSSAVRHSLRSSIEKHPDWVVCGEAENGKIALALVAELRPHLVILDLTMPVMNGLDAARAISRMAPGMPIIMFTMHELAGLRTDAQRVGITHVFPKQNGFGDDVLKAMREMLVLSAA